MRFKTIMPIVSPAPTTPERKAVPFLPATTRLETCRECRFNVDWKCEHAGCTVCPGQARKLGAEPLIILLTKPTFHCPMRKF